MATSFRPWAATALTMLALWAAASVTPLLAHEVPNDVLIQAYIKPEPGRLRMLVRVPLVAMRDMTWPFKGPDILDTSRADRDLHDAATLWLGDEATMYEGNRALPSPTVGAIRATLPSDRSFESYDQALALITGPPPAATDQISVKEGFLDVLFEYPGVDEHARFSFQPRWGRLGIQALTRVGVLLPDGTLRQFELHGDPGLVHLDPTLAQAAARFLKDGVAFIVDAFDHLLFAICLVLPFRRWRDTAVVLASFIAAHTVTLVATAYGLAPEALYFPSLVSTAVALSIVYMAVENIAGASLRRRWLAGAVFGLVHGISFALALRPEMQFAGSHFIGSLLSYALGIEAGLVVVVAFAIAIAQLLFRFVVAERIGTIVVSALIAHAGWHWLSMRGTLLWQYQFTAPELTPAFFADVVRWLMVLVTAAALTWLVGMLRRPELEAQSRTEQLSS